MKLTLVDIAKIRGILAIVLPSVTFPKHNVLQLKEGNYGLYIRTNACDQMTENLIVKKIKKHFGVEPTFWENSRTLKAATMKARRLSGTLIVEHPAGKKRVFTLYILG